MDVTDESRKAYADEAVSALECAYEQIPEDDKPASLERLFHYYIASAVVHALLAIAQAIEDQENGL